MSTEQQKEIEGAAEYLQFHNFKSVMEWITAEMILSRPEDPFQFIQKFRTFFGIQLFLEVKIDIKSG